MGATVALATTFETDVIRCICSFLDDSSVVNKCGSDASDVGNIAELSGLGKSREDFGMCILQVLQNQSVQRDLYHGSLEFQGTLGR